MRNPASASSARRSLSVLVLISLLVQLIAPLAAFPAGALAQDEAATPGAPVDTIAPVVTVPADIIVTADAATGTAVVTFDVLASDDVDGPVTADCDWASGSAFPAGTTTVTCTATDSAGNTGSGRFTVTVNPAPEPEPAQAPVSEPAETPAPAPTATEAPAPTATTRPVTGPPRIASDKVDYAPGERVTLTGTNWQPGEEIRIVVNDDQGQTWKRDVTIVADENGTITDAFNLPDWFVAAYTVTATGTVSGTATTSFTDANLRFLSNGPTLSNISWSKFSNNTCTTPLTGIGTSGSGNITSNDSATLNVDASANQWVKLTVPATAGGLSFVNWTATTGGGSFTTSDGGRTICAAGDNSSGLRRFTANYATATNTAPAANGQNVTTTEDTATSITLSGTDADGNTLTFSIVSGPSHGTLSALGAPSCSTVSGTSTCTASVTYTPAANYNGTDSFTFKVNDGTADSSSATVSITVTAVNDAPSFTKGADQTVNEDAGAQTVTGWATNISAGPSDESWQTLTFVVTNNNTALFSTQPAISSAGTLTYTPAPNAHGSATVTVYLKDDGGTANGGVDTSAPQTFMITINPVNDAPVAVDDAATTAEDTPVTINVRANDTDVDGDSLSVVAASITTPGHGTATLITSGADAGKIQYTPDANFHGTDSFTYKVSDGTVQSNAATVTITVTAVNDAPDAVDDSATVAEDSGANAIDVLANDTDVDGDTISVTAVGSASHGTAALVSGQVQYTPHPDYFGSDSFTYTIVDGHGGTATATVTITVTEVNDAPQATDDAQSLAEDGSVTFDPRTNDAPGPANESNQTLTVTDVTQGAHGTVTFTGSSVTYSPDPDFNGSDSFTYTVADDGTTNGVADPQSATATVSITVTAVNDAPVANGQSVTTDEDTSTAITLTASDVDGDSLTYTIVNGPVNGTLSGTAPNLIYTPDTNYNGVDSFTFKVNDGSDDSNIATVSITINPVNDAPVANAGGPYVDNEGSSIQLDGSGSSDVDGDPLTYAWSVSDSSVCSFDDATLQAPLLTCSDDGSFTVALTVTDDHSVSSSAATATVTVLNVAPTLTISGENSVDEGSVYTLSLNSEDPGDDTISKWTIDWGDGTVEELSGDPFTATHIYADGPAAYTITATATDEDGTFNANEQHVDVNNVAPTIHNVTNNGPVTEGSSATITVDASDPGGPNDPLSYEFDCDNDGTYELGPQAGNTTACLFDDDGVKQVNVRVTDGDGGSATGSTQVTVNNVAPTVEAGDDATINEGDTFSGGGSFSDPGADSWTATVNYGDGSGDQNLSLNSDKTFSLSHTYADNGTFTVTITVTDDEGDSGSDSLAVTVNNVAPAATFGNDGPVDEGDSFTLSLTDPQDVAADLPGLQYAFDCGDGSGYGAFSSSPTAMCPTSDNGTRAVGGKIKDKDGGETEYSGTVTVDNVAPVATFNAPASVSEGSSITISLTDPSDPSSADVDAGFAYAFDCGDGNGYGAFGNSTTASCPTTDNGTRTVKGKIRDKDGGVSEYSASVTVTNVAPAATLGNNGPVAEGSPVTISFSGQSDPSSADTSAGFHYAYSCANGDLSGATYAASSTSASTTCTFADNGSYTVRARIIDKDGGYSEYTTTVTVNNVAPSVTAPASQTADEGTAKAFNLGSFSDPGADSPWAVDVNWGDGSPHTTFNVTAAGSLGTASHTYADNGTYTVTVTVTDKDGVSDSKTFQVTVANVAPVITEATFGSSSVNCGANTVTLTVRFTDPGNDTHKILTDWSDTPANDNAEINPAVKGGAANTIQHTFNSGGPYWATVTVIELDPEAASAQTTSSQISVSYQVSGILPPINPNGSSVFKSGSTIPVKIQVLDCAGVPVATLAPKITIVKISGNDPSSSINEDFYSTSNADTGQVMRYSDGQYIYNLAAKSLSDQSATYELKISIPVNGTVVTVRFGLRTK